jgi:Tfp pilus assembly protein PilF
VKSRERTEAPARRAGQTARRQRRLAALSSCAALALAGCVAIPQFLAGGREPEPSPYGAYLAGRWAASNQSPGDAARYYSEALERAPGDPMLASEAFRAALLAGGWDDTNRLAEAVLAADPDNDSARMALAADAIGAGQWRRAVRLLEDSQFGPLDDITASVMLAWARAAQGDAQAALGALAEPREAALFAALVGLHQAMLLERAGDPSAASAFRNALDAYALPEYAAREYGRYLERQGRTDDAAEVYRARLEANPADRVSALELARLQAGGIPPRTAPGEAAALALYGAAAALIGLDFSDRAQAYLALSARMDEDFAPPRMMLAQIMAGQGRYDEAASMFEAAALDPAQATPARIWLAQLQSLRGEDGQAEEMLRALWLDNGEEIAARALAETLSAAERWAEAEAILNGLIEARAAAGQAPDWALLYGRAVARDRSGDWPGAEADFRAAIELNPDEASLLNYLGYTLVDRGENLEEGLDLIQRAIALQPRSGYIIDSLGWAYYRLGDFEDAVINLERAVALDPGAADINDHLGDAYWRVGRHLEARFQWRRALTLEPEDELRRQAEGKLANGLPPLAEPPAMAEKR